LKENEDFDVVNSLDSVISSKPRSEVYGKKLPHRIVHLFVFNKAGDMLLQKRAKGLSFCPLYWCTAAAGHVKAGEYGEEAAVRECKEELGFTAEPVLLFKDLDYFDSGKHHKILYSFKTVRNGNFKPNPAEVEEIRFFSIEEIQHLVTKREKIHPETLFILTKHFGIKTKT